MYLDGKGSRKAIIWDFIPNLCVCQEKNSAGFGRAHSFKLTPPFYKTLLSHRYNDRLT